MWKQRLGRDATYKNLIDVFEKAGYKQFANVVENEASNCENGVSRAGELDSYTSQTISANEAKIEDSFSVLLQKLGKALRVQEQLDVDEVHDYLMGICSTVPKASLNEMLKFVKLKNGWNYQNYGPLDNFVKRFLPHERKLMVKYKNDLSGFCVTVKLIDYIRYKNYRAEELEAPVDGEQHSRSELCVKLKDKLEVERRVSTHSLQYVYDLWEDVAEEFDIPCLTTVIHKIIAGSLIIVWLVLADTAEKIASSASTNKSIHFFLQHEIVFVAINNKPLFDTIVSPSHTLLA